MRILLQSFMLDFIISLKSLESKVTERMWMGWWIRMGGYLRFDKRIGKFEFCFKNVWKEEKEKGRKRGRAFESLLVR